MKCTLESRSILSAVACALLLTTFGCAGTDDGSNATAPVSQETRSYEIPRAKGAPAKLDVILTELSPTQETAALTLKAGNRELMSSTIEYTPDSVHAETWIEGQLFTWDFVQTSPGEFEIAYANDSASFALDHQDGSEPTEDEAFAIHKYLESTEESPGVTQAASVLEDFLLTAVELDEFVIATTAALTGVRGELVANPDGAISDYMQCIREACVDSGACWLPRYGCDFCADTPFTQAVGIVAVHMLAVELCWFDLINPILDPIIDVIE